MAIVAQRDRLSLDRAGDRHVEQRLDRLDVLLGILHADVVLVVADRVDPEVLLVELDAGVEGGDHVLHHVRLVQPEVGGLGLVDVDDVLGVVEPLEDAAVDDAVDLFDLAVWIASATVVGLLQVLARRCGC